MKQRLRLLIPTLCLWLFTHLKRVGGVSLSFKWFDLFLVVSWLVAAPIVLAKLEAAHALRDQKKANSAYVKDIRQNTKLYQDFVNYTPTFASMMFENGAVDQVPMLALRFGVRLVLVLLAPFIVIVGLLRGGQPPHAQA